MFGAANGHSQEVQNRPCVGGARPVYTEVHNQDQEPLSGTAIEYQSILPQCSLETIVGLIHVELKLSRLLVVELLGCSHLVQ
jgi:hypothetical protein